MFREMRTYGRDPETVQRSKTKFRDPVKWPEPRMIFTCSWSDWFHKAADEWRDDAWQIVRDTPRHTYLILTKRPGRIHRCLPDDWGDGYPNVWLGVSIESMRFNYRADQLREVPAARRFISAEPLLGSLLNVESGRHEVVRPSILSAVDDDLPGALDRVLRTPLNLDGIDLVICGGESGSRAEARPMHPEWARELRDACHADDPTGCYCDGLVEDCVGECHTVFHFKQWGAWVEKDHKTEGVRTGEICLSENGETYLVDDHYVCASNESDGTWMRYAGPKPTSGGHLLDGLTFQDMPDRHIPAPETLF